MELRLPLEMSPGREAACRAVFGTWGFYKTWINPQFAYVLPAGKEKIVKIVFEGATQMWDFINRDQSIEIHTYKKMGAAIMTHHNWGIYQNTSIPDTSDFPYGM